MGEQKNLGRSILNNLDFFIAGIALTVLVFVTFFGVFARYFMGNPFAWEEEVQLACFVWITFLGVGAAFRTGSHVAIEILVERMPGKVAHLVELGGYVISMGILLFFFYCFCGWVWESAYVSVCERKLVNRGFLKGPFLPIYGSGAICILIVTIPVRGNIPAMCIVGMVAATVLEYITGYVMERLFKVRYWDYTGKFLNVHGYICLM